MTNSSPGPNDINAKPTEKIKKYCVKETKILGFIFTSYGISEDMITKSATKIKNKCECWDKFRLNLLERIVIFKCLIFSKIQFVTNFLVIDKK